MFRILIQIIIATLLLSNLSGESIARLIKAEGKVNFKRMGMATFSEKASLGTAVNNGDAIDVGENGFAVIMYLDDKTVLKVHQNTQFEFLDTQNTRTIDLEFGTILNDVQREGRTKTFRIQTPISVASVKGTKFAAIVSQTGVDQFIGKEGLFEVMNMISGESVSVGPGQKAISNATGNLLQAPAAPGEYPPDPELEPYEEKEPPSEREEPKSSEEPVQETQPQELEPEVESIEPETQPDTPEPETVQPTEPMPEEIPSTEDTPEDVDGDLPTPSKKPFGMGLGIGSVTLDGVLYNQLALRPEINIGKIGVGLDLVIYIDNEGNVRSDEWDIKNDPSLLLDKIMFIRYGEKSDPVWVKYGSMESVTLGYGGLMNGYSNMMEFPSVRRVGINTGFNVGPVSGEIFLSNVKDFSRGGTLLGLRTAYTVSEDFPLSIGVNVVSDANMFSGLKDGDDDSYPDIFDDFPTDPAYSIDTDSDGIADDDPLELDIDGDGLTDILYPGQYEWVTDTLYLDSNIVRKAKPFSLENNTASVLGWSVDIGYPVFKSKAFSLDVYSEFNNLNFPEAVTVDSTFTRIKRNGTGITIPGIRSSILGLLNISLEYRIVTGSFLPGFFDQSYDLNRVVTRSDSDKTTILTKDMFMFDDSSNNFSSAGYFGSASMNLFNLASFTASYANMEADSVEYKSFYSYLSLNTDNIPKISSAMAYYQRNNDENPFDFENPSQNTIMGYRVGYELSKGVSLIWDFRQYYRDDGTGTLEPIKQTTIETTFDF
jgi:hypothetical protein